ncbi:2-oxoglutarate (2OG) and Fe(II)-dependent oxygenase superfamily protein [Actinidia rufa]|uniref:2-oxoglutarate (2OG) and Fe(II)-dependent oxygenase superfamily protein n=1 Tax=Actinidia rufa TaxID=165716 RepID=A0A7J0FZI0_9ERIC|nr:2-oxoglutarate (2OG) and Fe(II)-dependent oxygenase superfamily protein [Actinidia rufa]
MGSETPLRLPTIDFSTPELNPGTPDWDSVKAQVRKALQEYGCFEAFFSKIPLDLRKALFGALEELFDLPLQTKLRNASKKPFHGYVGLYPMVPLFESMGIDDAPVPEKAKAFSQLLWPEENPNF